MWNDIVESVIDREWARAPIFGTNTPSSKEDYAFLETDEEDEGLDPGLT